MDQTGPVKPETYSPLLRSILWNNYPSDCFHTSDGAKPQSGCRIEIVGVTIGHCWVFGCSFAMTGKTKCDITRSAKMRFIFLEFPVTLHIKQPHN